ncbi:MAG: DEAD/DEAH box helicase family protein, partial [Clostridia bacterium]|nr:DEAD/DEAH box helicase family protein [Clostridia bacterium]
MELYNSNKVAYGKVQDMFKLEDKAAIIHATGTGKSFIALQWLYDNRDKRCLFLAPTYEIIDQLERHMRSQGFNIKDFPNLKRMTYDNLAGLSAQDLNNLHVDNIVLDEFHRCGAPTWGKAVNALLRNNPTTKVLGI